LGLLSKSLTLSHHLQTHNPKNAFKIITLLKSLNLNEVHYCYILPEGKGRLLLARKLESGGDKSTTLHIIWIESIITEHTGHVKR
jgi:hypothetical protein